MRLTIHTIYLSLYFLLLVKAHQMSKNLSFVYAITSPSAPNWAQSNPIPIFPHFFYTLAHDQQQSLYINKVTQLSITFTILFEFVVRHACLTNLAPSGLDWIHLLVSIPHPTGLFHFFSSSHFSSFFSSFFQVHFPSYFLYPYPTQSVPYGSYNRRLGFELKGTKQQTEKEEKTNEKKGVVLCCELDQATLWSWNICDSE